MSKPSPNLAFPSYGDSPVVAVTVGDPLGIGPEILVKALHSPGHWAGLILQIYGHRSTVERTAQDLQLSHTLTQLEQAGTIQWVDIPGDPHQQAGAIAYTAIERAVADMAQGKAHGLVTGPIHKERLHQAGIPYGGHTEMLQDLAQRYYGGTYQSDMVFADGPLRMVLLTRHVPLSQVGQALNLSDAKRTMAQFIQYLRHREGLQCPNLALLGVNPHAGEIGGVEEDTVLRPLAAYFRESGQCRMSDPLPADAAFRGVSRHHIPVDGYIATYHDQGLIPFKLLAGYDAVNITIGLPFWRVSVSHGTADDIVGQGIADPTSLLAALATQVRWLVPSSSMPSLSVQIASEAADPVGVMVLTT